MVTPGISQPRARLTRAVAAIAMALGCTADPIVPPSANDPFLYVVLNQRTVSDVDGVARQHALLITPRAPTEVPLYRPAQRIEMRRVSDGTQFGWRGYGLTGGLVQREGVGLGESNYYLPDSATAPDTLGALSLQPGEAYDLYVETDGVTIRGSVIIPGQVLPIITQENNRGVVRWPKATGAGGYVVALPGPDVQVVLDTFFVLPSDLPRGSRVVVQALDHNLHRFLVDRRLGRSGLDNGFGVFGALTEASVVY